MTTDNHQSELLQIIFTYPMPYEWSIGLYGSRFFQEIKERGRFIGIRCDGCGTVYVPPRRVCGPCFRELTELVPLSDTGVITAFSVVNYPFIDPNTGSQRPIPYTYGYIKLDGGDSIFSHIINEMDLSKIKVGMKVRAVFKDRKDMQGNIQDIKYFEIIG
jgi:uncharacterized OB-fold protein